MEELFSAAEECLHRAEFCIIEEDELQLSALYPKLESIFRALGNIYANESDGDIAEISNFFLNQVTDILEIIEEGLKHPTEAGVRLPKTANNGPGRPSYIIPGEEVKMLKNTGLAWTKIADFFNVSAKTLKRRMKASNLQLVERKTNIQDHDLDVALRDIIDEHPSSGYTYVWASLKARNIFVPFRRVITRMKVLDPIGIFLRSRRRILRRKFKVKASRYLWCIDGDEKLFAFRMYIHGAIDGYSRKVIYVTLTHNKTAEKILDVFIDGVRAHGVPIRVRGDRGTEMALIKEFMSEVNTEINNPFIAGRSVHNTRIERLWGEVNRVVISKFKIIFMQLEDQGLLDEHSLVDLLCLSYIYYGRVNKSIQNFVAMWNAHSLSTESSRTPDQLWAMSTIQQRLTNPAPHHQQSDCSESSETLSTDNSFYHKQLLDFSAVMSVSDLKFFEFLAMQIVADPLMDDHNDGKQIYALLRTVVCKLFE